LNNFQRSLKLRFCIFVLASPEQQVAHGLVSLPEQGWIVQLIGLGKCSGMQVFPNDISLICPYILG
jgi:hypothetical protein